MMEDFSFALSDYWRLCETWDIWVLDDDAGLGIFGVCSFQSKWKMVIVLFYVVCGFYKAVQFEW